MPISCIFVVDIKSTDNDSMITTDQAEREKNLFTASV